MGVSVVVRFVNCNSIGSEVTGSSGNALNTCN